jgi:hypothetical protein
MFPKESFLLPLKQSLKDNAALLALNEEAFARGAKAAQEASPALCAS